MRLALLAALLATVTHALSIRYPGSEEAVNDVAPESEDDVTDRELQELGATEDMMGKRSLIFGRSQFRPGKRSLALGRTKFRPGKRSLTLGRLGFRPGKRSLALGRNGFRPGKRSEPGFIWEMQ